MEFECRLVAVLEDSTVVFNADLAKPETDVCIMVEAREWDTYRGLYKRWTYFVADGKVFAPSKEHQLVGSVGVGVRINNSKVLKAAESFVENELVN